MRMTADQFKALTDKGLTVIGQFGSSLDLQTSQVPGMGKVTIETGKPLKEAPRHKFGAIADERDGIKFPSKAEALYYDHLETCKRGGALLFYLRQVPFHIPGGKLVVDYVEFWKDGLVRIVDVKGMVLPIFALKRRAVERCYPVKVEVARLVKGTWEFS